MSFDQHDKLCNFAENLFERVREEYDFGMRVASAEEKSVYLPFESTKGDLEKVYRFMSTGTYEQSG